MVKNPKKSHLSSEKGRKGLIFVKCAESLLHNGELLSRGKDLHRALIQLWEENPAKEGMRKKKKIVLVMVTGTRIIKFYRYYRAIGNQTYINGREQKIQKVESSL